MFSESEVRIQNYTLYVFITMINATQRDTRIFAESKDDEIYISGIAGRFPNARNVRELEHKLYNKV